VGAEPVAEQQGQPLVRRAVQADVEVHVATGVLAGCPQALDPLPAVVRPAGRDVIPFIGRPMEAEGAERPVEVADGVFEAGHGGLKIEDILGRHTGDRSTADVLDPLGACP